MIENIKSRIDEIDEKIAQLRETRASLESELTDEFLKLGKVKGLVEFIVFNGFPTYQIFDSFGTDFGEYCRVGDVGIKVVPEYGYTDIEGLTEEEFGELRALLGDEDSQFEDFEMSE